MAIRLYRFLSADFGLKAAAERRLRISRIAQLNDEFEFLGLALDEKVDRVALREVKDRAHRKTGVICMSANWSHPLQWGHYGASFTGVALGYDVLESQFQKIKYVQERPTLASMGYQALDDLTPDDIKELMCTKFDAWSYEDEYRTFVELKSKEVIKGVPHYFHHLDALWRLKEFIVGPRTPLKRKDVMKALQGQDVDVFQARAAFKDFRVVRQRQDSMWR